MISSALTTVNGTQGSDDNEQPVHPPHTNGQRKLMSDEYGMKTQSPGRCVNVVCRAERSAVCRFRSTWSGSSMPIQSVPVLRRSSAEL
jgi:hypothetical protein